MKFRKKPSIVPTDQYHLPAPVESSERDQFPMIGTTLSPYAHQPLTGAPLEPPKKKFDYAKATKRLAVVLGVVLVLGLSWTGWKLFTNLHKVFGGNPLALLTTQRLKGEDRGRVNILLTGNSADDPGHGGGQLTDSIMVLSIDTQANTAFMLSIPRDLWVPTSSYSYGKINSLYVLGEQNKFSASGYPDGGIGKLEQTIHENFGLQIDYYALVNYTAVKQAVDAVGGVDVTIASSDPRGLYDANIARADGGPLKLANGTQHLDGQTALNLTRARGDSYYSYGFPRSDFDRTEHQRQVVLALKTKAVSAGTLSNPVKLGQLFDSLGANVETDVQSKEIRRMYDVIKKVPNSSIKSVSLNSMNGKNLLTSYRSSDGQSALIPAAGVDDYSVIQAAIQQLFDTSGSTSKTTSTTQ